MLLFLPGLLFIGLLLPVLVFAQSSEPHIHLSKAPTSGFQPTCNLDSNSVGFYFFPPNLGAKWTLRTISQTLDLQNNIVHSDTTFSFERVISDSNHSLQGLPILKCESSLPYHAGGEDSAKVQNVEYYVDDSVVMTVFNHSISSALNHTLIVNPLRMGASWKDVADDTIRTSVIATEEPVSTPLGEFPSSLVLQSPTAFGEMSKYLVKGVGIVKIIFRGLLPKQNGTFVVTSDLISLDRGDPTRSIKYRFQPAKTAKQKGHKLKKGTSNVSK